MSKRDIINRIICVLLVAALLFTTACGSKVPQSTGLPASTAVDTNSDTPAQQPEEQTAASRFTLPEGYVPYYEEKTGLTVPLAELPRENFSVEETDAHIAEFKALLEHSGNEEKLFEVYEAIRSDFDKLSTDYSLANYDRDLNPTDEKVGERYVSYNQLGNTYNDLLLVTFSDVLNTEYADAFEAYIGKENADFLREYKPLTPEMEALINELTEMENRYAELNAAEIAEDETEQWKAELKQLYVDMVNNYNALAGLKGYENYAEYAYKEDFCRDFGFENVFAIADEIALDFQASALAITDTIVLKDKINGVFNPNTDSTELSYEKIIDYMYELNPELAITLEHLLSTGLADMDHSDAKMNVGYTMTLAEYDDAFIFDNPSPIAMHYTAKIHEFGHYNYFYHSDLNEFYTSSSTDVREIHSQGLEALFSKYYPMLDELYGEALADYTIYNLFSVIVDAFAINEAEYRVFTTENLTVEKVDQIFAEMAEKYHIFNDFVYHDGNYVNVSHLYQTPFYYISYGVSALAVLELYALSLEDWDAAVDTYMQLTALPGNAQFGEALETVGLENIFDEGTIQNIAEFFVAYYEASDIIPLYIDFLEGNEQAA